jgi:DNA-directed RNA polymerase subunit RPC12/RpoP
MAKGRVWFEKNSNGKFDLHGEGVVTTDETCSNCSKIFRMRVDFNVNGNHVVQCPHCGHHHCRVIKDGVVTSDRWESRNRNEDILPTESYWKSSVIGAKTTTAFSHIRERWLGRVHKQQ